MSEQAYPPVLPCWLPSATVAPVAGYKGACVSCPVFFAIRAIQPAQRKNSDGNSGLQSTLLLNPKSLIPRIHWPRLAGENGIMDSSTAHSKVLKQPKS